MHFYTVNTLPGITVTMTDVELTPMGAPTASASTCANGADTSATRVTLAVPAVRFERSVCCAYTLHVFSAGILGHMYAGA